MMVGINHPLIDLSSEKCVAYQIRKSGNRPIMTIWSPRTNVTKINVLSLGFRAKNLLVLYVFIDKVVEVW